MFLIEKINSMPSEKQLLHICDRKRSKIETQLNKLGAIIGIPDRRLIIPDTVTGIPMNPRGFITMPNGDVISELEHQSYLVDKNAGEYEFEANQRIYCDGHFESMAQDRDLAIELSTRGEWYKALEQLDILEGKIYDLGVEERYSRRDPDSIFDEVREAIEFLIHEKYSNIWTPEDSNYLDDEIFIEVSSKIAEGFVDNPQSLYSVDPRFFEELVGTVFSKMGYEVCLTQRTRDGGRDILAIGNPGNIMLKHIIECKRYKKERKVSVSQVRELYGVKISEGASKAIIATTSGFTKDAVAFAEKHTWELQLIDYRELLSLIKRSIVK